MKVKKNIDNSILWVKILLVYGVFFSLTSNIEMIFQFISQSRICNAVCFFLQKRKFIFWFKSSFSVFNLVNIYQISFRGIYIVFETNCIKLIINFDLVLPWYWLCIVHWRLQRKVDRSFKNSNSEVLRKWSKDIW